MKPLPSIRRKILSAAALLAVLFTRTLMAAEPAQESAPAAPADGVWQPVSAVLAGTALPEAAAKSITLTLKDGNYEVTVKGEPRPDKGTVKTDTTTTPPRITITGVEGPNKGKTFLAIYETGKTGEAEFFRVCYDLTGNAFPEKFESTAATKHFLVEYRRPAAKAPPKAADAAEDAKRQNGTWKPAGAMLGGVKVPAAELQKITLTIKDGNYEVVIAGEPHPDKGTSTLDTSVTPKRMTIQSLEGANKGKTILAIYEMGRKGDTDNDDVLLGGPGPDTLDAGTGENVSLGEGINVTGNVATIFGDANANTITISRDAAGAFFSNGVAIPGATVANTSLIRVFGLAGNDVITLSETNGALPRAFLFGGAGTDVLTGGSDTDFIFGGINNDTLLGKGSTDFIFGGAGTDTITPGDADDVAWGEADNDRLIWNPGDDTDVVEGGGGTDIMEVNGGNGAEEFTATSNGTRVSFDRVTPAPFNIDIGTTESLVLNANGGNDIVTAGSLAGLITLTVDGGAGDDILSGSNGADIILGGDGIDTIDGNIGNDTIFAGAGADTIKWDPGDGSDVIEGQADADILLFNGSNASENIVISANGGRVLFTRDVSAVTMDLNDVENIEFNAFGGTDSVTVNSLAGTDVTMVVADLAASAGGGDGFADTITLNGTAAVENFSLGTLGTAVTVFGIIPTVRIFQSELANDHVVLNGLGGTDTISVGAGVTGLIDVKFNQ